MTTEVAIDVFWFIIGGVLLVSYILYSIGGDPELEKRDRESDERQKLIDAGKIGIARKIS